MRFPYILPACLILLTSSCAKTLEKQTRDQVRTLAGSRLDKESVTVTRIRESGGYATAEITVTTAVKLKAVGSDWVLDEIRVGEDRWEKVDRILNAIESQRRMDTLSQLSEMARAYTDLHRETGKALANYASFQDLMDALTPHFTPKVIRLDGWLTPYRIDSPEAGQSALRSAGPDRKFDTQDDLVQPL